MSCHVVITLTFIICCSIFKVTQDGSVRVRAGSPLHCQVASETSRIGKITSLSRSRLHNYPYHAITPMYK